MASPINPNLLLEPSQPSPDDNIDSVATSDYEMSRQPYLMYGIDGSPQPILAGYSPRSILDMAYGGSDPTTMAAQYVQSGELFRLQRGFPYKRAGRNAPVFPQFKAQNLVLINLSSQPQANTSAAQISNPTAQANTTNVTSGSVPVIGFPGFNGLSFE